MSRFIGSIPFPLKRRLGILLLAAFLPIPNIAIAQVKQLLTPVTWQEELAAIRSHNSYFLKKHLYSAKYSRIVKVNTGVLLSEEPFEIPLFNNESLSLVALKVDVHGDGNIINWQGTVADPYLSVGELQSQVGSVKTASLIHDSMFGIVISALLYQQDPETGISIRVPSPNTAPKALLRQVSLPKELPTFYGAGAYFRSANRKKSYKLIALPFGGDSHLLIQVDPKKLVPAREFAASDNSVLARRSRAAKEFRESLGPDPRLDIFRALSAARAAEADKCGLARQARRNRAAGEAPKQ